MKWILYCGLLATATICRAGVSLSISPSTQSVPNGSQVTVAVNVSGLGNGTALGTYDINIAFDPTLLSYSGASFGNQLNILGLGDIQMLTPGTGTVEVFELSLDSASNLNTLQASSFTLVTLTFNTIAPGTNSPITLSVNALGDAFGNSIASTLQQGSVTILTTSSPSSPSATPAPSSLLLVFLGAAAISVLTGIRRSNARRMG